VTTIGDSNAATGAVTGNLNYLRSGYRSSNSRELKDDKFDRNRNGSETGRILLG